MHKRFTGNTLSGATHPSSTDSRYLVLSGVFRVGNFTTTTTPVVESVAVTSDPGSAGEYVKDDAIKVTVTFFGSGRRHRNAQNQIETR